MQKKKKLTKSPLLNEHRRNSISKQALSQVETNSDTITDCEYNINEPQATSCIEVLYAAHETDKSDCLPGYDDRSQQRPLTPRPTLVPRNQHVHRIYY